MIAPTKGQRWTHTQLRGVWTVQSAGPKFVTMRCSLPFISSKRIPTEGFMQRQAEGKWRLA
jgi:hypothetical protein